MGIRCLCVGHAHKYVNARSPGEGVTDSCDYPMEVLELILSPLQEQFKLLTEAIALAPQSHFWVEHPTPVNPNSFHLNLLRIFLCLPAMFSFYIQDVLG